MTGILRARQITRKLWIGRTDTRILDKNTPEAQCIVKILFLHFLFLGWCMFFCLLRKEITQEGGGGAQSGDGEVDYWLWEGSQRKSFITSAEEGPSTVWLPAKAWELCVCKRAPPWWIVTLCDPESNSVCDPLWGICALCCQWKIYHTYQETVRGSACGLHFTRTHSRPLVNSHKICITVIWPLRAPPQAKTHRYLFSVNLKWRKTAN